ncbi:hypothetical protein [Acinetobacter sp. P1(2025)]|uniref:hypothetical protein n=1 Tax=Acinetobacter sp. P1(2025) TaxID=3446120 RepID=UPI003F53782E
MNQKQNDIYFLILLDVLFSLILFITFNAISFTLFENFNLMSISVAVFIFSFFILGKYIHTKLYLLKTLLSFKKYTNNPNKNIGLGLNDYLYAFYKVYATNELDEQEIIFQTDLEDQKIKIKHFKNIMNEKNLSPLGSHIVFNIFTKKELNISAEKLNKSLKQILEKKILN